MLITGVCEIKADEDTYTFSFDVEDNGGKNTHVV